VKDRYYGRSYWTYDGPLGRGETKLPVPTGNYREDEGMARHLLRKKLGIKRLPAEVRVYPNR
jgi:hypothetical protein